MLAQVRAGGFGETVRHNGKGSLKIIRCALLLNFSDASRLGPGRSCDRLRAHPLVRPDVRTRIRRVLAAWHPPCTPGTYSGCSRTGERLVVLWRSRRDSRRRLGSALFYHFDRLLTDPWMILRIWEGGMSFHGGLIGVLVAIWLWQRKSDTGWLATVDFCAPMVPIGLFFGRIGNFINGELWGRPTDLPWGVIFPAAGPEPRHPSQLYEAALEGLLLFAVLWWFARKPRAVGAVAAVFALRLCHGPLRSGIRSPAGCPAWLSRVRLADHGSAALHPPSPGLAWPWHGTPGALGHEALPGPAAPRAGTRSRKG